MRLTIEPKGEIIEVEGVPCRRWIGSDDHGVPVEVMVRCLAPQTDDEVVAERYRRELEELPQATVQTMAFDPRFFLD